MLLTQLEGFIAAAREGSVGRAARQLHISQPALTARLQALERELDIQLFIRTPQGVRLSEAGQTFLPHAQDAVNAISRATRLVEDLRHTSGGQLALATAPGLSTYVLPPLLKRFRAAYPAVRISVRTGHPEEVLELVLRDEAQLGFGCDVVHPEIDAIPLCADQLVLAVAPSHRLAGHTSVEPKELAQEQVIMFRTSSFGDVLAQVFRRAGVSADGVMELDSLDAAKRMVAAGVGVALLPRVAIEKDEVDSGRLTWCEIRGVRALNRAIVAFRRRDAGALAGPPAQFLSPDIVREAMAPLSSGRR